MSTPLPVQNYPKDCDDQVLDLVKKYPLYSLDKLKSLLPDFSRHAIQNILEKYKLSTIEERLALANQKIIPRPNILINKNFFNKISGISRLLTNLRFKLPKLTDRRQLFTEADISRRRKFIISVSIILILLFIVWSSLTVITASAPAITVISPAEGFVNQGAKLYISGKMFPAKGKITVNGQPLALNGDGGFSGVINIPMDDSVLKFEASYFGKKSEIIRLVKRTPTAEEQQAKQKQEADARQKTVDKVAQLDKDVNDLLAAKKANSGMVKILNNHVQTDSGFSSVIGEVSNQGQTDASWVMVTANFFDQAGTTIDTKYGFATDFGQIIKPGATAKFETQATSKQFNTYNLSVSWEEGQVAGVAHSQLPGQATPSATPMSTPSATWSPILP